MEVRSFQLCEGSGPTSIVGCSFGRKRQEVLVTVQGDGVACYDAAKQARLRSWPVGNHELRIATEGVYDHRTEHYYSLLESDGASTRLAAWQDDQSRAGTLAEESAKLPLSGAVHSAFPVGACANSSSITLGGFVGEGHKTGLVMVLKDGSVVSLEQDGSLSGPVLTNPVKGRVSIEATATSDVEASEQSALLHIVLVVAAETSRELQVVQLGVGGDALEGLLLVHRLELVAPRPEQKGSRVLAASCSRKGEVTVLWSSGTWEVYGSFGDTLKRMHTRELSKFQLESALPQLKPTPSKSSKKRRAADDSAETTSTSSPAALAAVSGTSFVALAAYQATGSLGLALLDSHYGCVHGIASLSPESQAVGPVFLKSGDQPGMFLVSTPEVVIVAELELPSLSLASLVGALAGGTNRVGNDGSLSNHQASTALQPHWPDSARSIEKGKIAVRADETILESERADALRRAEDEALERIGNPSSSVEDIESTITRFARGEAQEPAGPSSDSNGGAEGTKTKGTKRLPQLPGRLLSALAERSLKSGFWSLMSSLVASGQLVSPAIYPGLLEELASKQQLGLLEKCLRSMPDIPPASLTFLLKFYLGTSETESAGSEQLLRQQTQKRRTVSQLIDSAVGKRKAGKSLTEEQTAVLLAGAACLDKFSPSECAMHALLVPQRDEAVLFAALSPLTPVEIKALAQYLAKWLAAYDKLPFTNPPTDLSPNLHVPALMQVITWSSLLLDAHLTKFMMLPDCKEAALQLRGAVASQVAFAKRLGPLEGMASHVKRKMQLPGMSLPGTANAAYTVEYLDLS